MSITEREMRARTIIEDMALHLRDGIELTAVAKWQAEHDGHTDSAKAYEKTLEKLWRAYDLAP
jgi:hypothetical protein